MKLFFYSAARLGAGVLLATVAFVSPPAPAEAASGREREPNGTPAQATNLDALFSLGHDPTIAHSTTVPHASVRGRGIATAFGRNSDFFSFHITQSGFGFFDIDSTRSFRSIASDCRGAIVKCESDPTETRFDTRLALYGPDFTLLTLISDDAPADLGAAGSNSNSPLRAGWSLDPFLEFSFETLGLHYLEVQFFALDGYRRQEGEYTLHTSLSSACRF